MELCASTSSALNVLSHREIFEGRLRAKARRESKIIRIACGGFCSSANEYKFKGLFTGEGDNVRERSCAAF